MNKAVNPNHYRDNNHQIIEVIRWMSFDIGNAIKYVYRYNRKENPVQDLEKALWYLNDYKSVVKFSDLNKDREESIRNIDKNNFVPYLEDGFIKDTVLDLIALYKSELMSDRDGWELIYAHCVDSIKQKIDDLS